MNTNMNTDMTQGAAMRSMLRFALSKEERSLGDTLAYYERNAERFAEFLEGIEGLGTEEQWVSGDARPGRSEERWLNLKKGHFRDGSS